jgi:hypothetical protein
VARIWKGVATSRRLQAVGISFPVLKTDPAMGMKRARGETGINLVYIYARLITITTALSRPSPSVYVF